MPIKKTHHFLVVEDDGRCKYLSALPGQTLRGKPLSTGVTVKPNKECGRNIRCFPVGTVFGTTTLKKAHKGMASFYTAKDLYLLSADDASPDMFTSTTRDELLEEYGQFRAAQEREPDNKLRSK